MNISQTLVLLALSASASGAQANIDNSALKPNNETKLVADLNLAFHEDPILGETREAGAKWKDADITRSVSDQQ